MAEGPASEGLDRLARDVLDNVLEGYQVISPELRYLYLNDAAVRHARAPRAALLGRTMGEVHPGIEHTPMFTLLQRCMKQRDSMHMESELTYPDGRTSWFELRFIAVPQGVLVCSVELTERRRTEGEVLRARRVLAVISESNQALVRASDERELMREVCRIAVERGGYRMAWIGSKEHDDACSIRPVASAGVDDGYTEGLQLSWDEAQPRGRGPTGRAVREGGVAIARFLSSDPFFDPWREAALTRGFASSIALPFRVDGAVCGALCIYSGEPNAFDAHETRLLEELALDLGHGVQALRARAASQRSAAQLAYLNERLKRLARVLQAFSRTRDVEAMLRLVCSAARELANADAATFALAEGDSCTFVEEDAEVPFWKGRRVPMSECIGGCVIRQRETVVVHDLAADPRISAQTERPPGVCSLAMVPIRREDPLGAIAVYWSTPHRATEDDLGLLETLADSVAIQMERLRMLGELTESEDRYRTLIENLEDIVFSLDAEGRFQYVSPSIAKYGYTPEEIVGTHFSGFAHEDDLSALAASFARTLGGAVEPSTFRTRARSGQEHVVRTSSRVVMRGGRAVGVSGVMIDLTELKRAEEQLRVSQKMEAIGQLAGGIAHDFNNLLSVILSYAGFVGDVVKDDAQARDDVQEIVKAGTRAVALTRQLLAFSRKQVLEPQVLDLNQLAGDLERMLHRLIGEDIELVQRRAPDLGQVRADPGQIEQVVMNLVVNARDAMPDGGTLTIETSNVELDHDYAEDHVSIPAGSYVVLSISDTGCGMDETTRKRLFEPFYTTKEVGKGTGLGLSTVYGIVTQSGGRIWFSSEPGVGTTFKVHLPRVEGRASPSGRPAGPEPSARGDETILVVEDDDAVRAIAERVLRAAGYHVIAAEDGAQALRVWEQRGDSVDLLLTDVVMPRMSGKQLAQRMIEQRPSLRVLFMSGYTDNIIARHGVLEPGTLFIGKPFSAGDLAKKVRSALDARGERA